MAVIRCFRMLFVMALVFGVSGVALGMDHQQLLQQVRQLKAEIAPLENFIRNLEEQTKLLEKVQEPLPDSLIEQRRLNSQLLFERQQQLETYRWALRFVGKRIARQLVE